MRLAIVRHELSMMIRSKKNIFFLIALASILLSYCFFILPSKETADSFNPEEIKGEINNIDAIREGLIARGGTGWGPMMGNPYATYTNERNYLSRMVYAFNDQDFDRFIQLRMKVNDHSVASQTSDWMLIGTAPYSALESMRDSSLSNIRYQDYIETDVPMTYEIIEQKTALQTIVNFLIGTGAALVIICAIYFSSDMLSRDRAHRSIVQGMPIGWYRLINVKSIAAFIYTSIVLFGFFILAIIVISLQTGLGSLKLAVPITIPSTQPDDYFGYRFSEYDTITIAKFLLFTIGIIPILIYLFIRINAFLNLLFRNSWIVLMIGTAILFSERIYFSRTTTELFGIDLSKFPQTYFDFGRIISGEKYYLLHLESITYEKGIIVLLIGIIIVEIILFITARLINKRRFYEKSA